MKGFDKMLDHDIERQQVDDPESHPLADEEFTVQDLVKQIIGSFPGDARVLYFKVKAKLPHSVRGIESN